MRPAHGTIAFCVCAVLASASPGATAVPSAARLQAAVAQAAASYMADPCHVGLSIAAVSAGETVFYDAGSVRRDRVQKPTPDSVYELASVTKTFVGVLAARALVDRRMTLDEDFRIHLPGRYPNLALAGRPITLRTLATHTSGLQRDLPDSDAVMAKPDYDRIGFQLADLNKGFGRARSLAALHGVELKARPGERFAYSNIGVRVIGYGLERAYRLPLPQLLRREILDPLGMLETTFAPGETMRTRRVTPYNRYGRVQPYHDASAGAAHGLYSTSRDMARYLAWHLDEADPVVARAHSPIRGVPEEGEGLIWNLGRDGDAPMIWHGGGSFGATSQMVLFPSERTGFVLLANDACEGSEAALKAIAISARAGLRSGGRRS